MSDFLNKLCETEKTDRINRIRGSLVGGAVGDALGYRVEFMQDFLIFKRYGECGITEYELRNGIAEISDDTQMTLFTAEGLLHAKRKYSSPSVDAYADEIYKSYLDWYVTQSEPYSAQRSGAHSDLLSVAELFAPRAPGGTCLRSLESGRAGSLDFKINFSKGCGGVMRVAPIALMLSGNTAPEVIDEIAARSSAITHGHILGILPSVLVSRIIAEILEGKSMREATEIARRAITAFVGDEDKELLTSFDAKIARAISLADDKDVDPLDAIHELGEGWVAEETAVIAIYCALRFSDSFADAIIASVNHSGDSDSTGSVTGNIIGAYLGYSAIPECYLEKLEHRELLLKMADKLVE